jgi:hypothetical protein
MWATLALAAVLQPVPAQGGKLAIKNDRVTYGILGQERKDAKLLPGDVYVVTFDIEGLTVNNADGKVLYSMGMELTNAEGKVQFKKDPQDLEAINALGGSRLPAFALSDIGLDTPPGQYTLKVTVADRAVKPAATQQLVRKFDVVPKKFGVVRLVLSNEKDTPVPPVAVPGQTVMVNFALVGFDLTDKKQPNLSVEMRILDENGKPTLTMPFVSGDVNNVEDQFKKIVPMQFIIAVNRSGTFTVELTAKDKVSNKSVQEKLELKVVELK